ncbi:hypothetical protein PROFUN_07778 [Planoprotostelium fungivorum]|uniref:Uncharacterized protein n=1 Tax=Planoprotostelium fungivorum TaxID=1890364 RepID=A0A2P6MX78_9EUKA|nr:hypothetical protein PROFUN_07778 [Planoprotostelium fungivorum]
MTNSADLIATELEGNHYLADIEGNIMLDADLESYLASRYESSLSSDPSIGFVQSLEDSDDATETEPSCPSEGELRNQPSFQLHATNGMMLRIDSIARSQIKDRRLQRASTRSNLNKTAGPAVIFEGDEMRGGTLKVYLVPERVSRLSMEEDIEHAKHVQLLEEIPIRSREIFLECKLSPHRPQKGESFHIFLRATSSEVSCSYLSEPFQLFSKVNQMEDEASKQQRRSIRNKRKSQDEMFDEHLDRVSAILSDANDEKRMKRIHQLKKMIMSFEPQAEEMSRFSLEEREELPVPDHLQYQ